VTFLDKKRGFDYRMFQRVSRAVTASQPDLIHTHLHALNYAIPAIIANRAIAAVHTVHSIAERERRRIGKLAPKLLFARRVAPVAIAAEVQASIRRVYGSESVSIPNGIPLDVYRSPGMSRADWRQREGFQEEDVLFVCVGRMDKVKNHGLLIDAFALAFPEAPNSNLILVGDGDLRHDLVRQAAALGLSERVHFLGARHDIPAILGACDVYTFASSYEGSPLSVMEAMAAGLPIVGTAVGGVPEMVPNDRAGILTPPGNASMMAAVLVRLYNDMQLRLEMGAYATRHAAQFDIQTMARSYELLYCELVGRRTCSFGAGEPVSQTQHLPDNFS
jgi:glycosyltransferase involved in cell wall biosynthesis